MNSLLFPIIINAVVIGIWVFFLFRDKEKGLSSLRVGWQTIVSMLPFLLIIIGLIGIGSSFVDQQSIALYLGEKAGIKGFIFVSFFSSLLQIPGIVAFPIAATLYHSGASASIVALFACASTMASVFTLPLEMKYVGKKLALLRMGLTYVLSIVVGILTGSIVHILTAL